MLSQQFGVVLEFLNQTTDFASFDFNYKWLRSLYVLGGDEQFTKKIIWSNLLVYGQNDFNRIDAVGS
jgi:hypothetical protein